MEKEKLENELKNMLRLFYQSLQDYELESGNKIGHDERSSEEMVQIFIESEDAFNYESVVKNCFIPDVSGWVEFDGNETIFNEYAKRNCLCKFDDGTECRYGYEHPMAILTHFRCE